MITARLMGGLGNQMFQVAAVSTLALREKECDFSFSFSNHYLPHQGNHSHSYKDNVFRDVPFTEKMIDTKYFYEYESMEYAPILFQDDTTYIGYFQSEKYFSDHSDYIHNLYSPTEEIDDYIFDKYDGIDFSTATFLHVRRGDYIKLSDTHPPCQPEYYQNAFDSLGKNDINQVLVFSDDIDWCVSQKDMIDDNIETIYIEGENDYIDLYMMSLCKNAIICNSSFSWWGAWLGRCNTIAPRKWFGPKGPNEWNDLYCENWVVI